MGDSLVLSIDWASDMHKTWIIILTRQSGKAVFFIEKGRSGASKWICANSEWVSDLLPAEIAVDTHTPLLHLCTISDSKLFEIVFSEVQKSVNYPPACPGGCLSVCLEIQFLLPFCCFTNCIWMWIHNELTCQQPASKRFCLVRSRAIGSSRLFVPPLKCPLEYESTF